MAPPAFNVLSLCSGIGGLDLGLRLSLPQARTVCYVEREAYAAAVLEARIADNALDDAPIWSDLGRFDGRPWRGVVDCVVAGFPCQPFSCAGKRLGTEDERWIWPEIARILREVGPRLVFLENVPGLLAGGLGHVLRDLAALGFDAQWGVLAAEAVGAPHRRKRVFILANSTGSGRKGRLPEAQQGGERSDDRCELVADARHFGFCERRLSLQGARNYGASRNELDGCDGAAVAYPIGERLEKWPSQPGDAGVQREAPERGCDGMAHTTRDEREQGWTESEGKKRGPHAPFCCVPFPPGPLDAAGWREYLARWPGLEPSVRSPESRFRRGADGTSGRVDRLRALGNGVVPDQATLAFRLLWERFH